MPDTMPDTCHASRTSLQGIARSRWTLLLFHVVLLSYCFGANAHVTGTILAWFIMQLGIHGGYHRYFTHRSFRTSFWFECLLGLAGCLAYQNGPVWWASKHRRHHQCADSGEDHHSPLNGFWHAHIAWLWDEGAGDIDWQYVPDLERSAAVWIENHQGWIHGSYVSAAYFVAGWNGVLNLWVLPIVLCWHTTFSTNSFCHLFGTHPHACQPHATCMAKNNFLVALVNLGEGWHNNHHAYPSCSHHGFYRWYQIDVTYCVLLVCERLGLVWGLKRRKEKPTQALCGDPLLD